MIPVTNQVTLVLLLGNLVFDVPLRGTLLDVYTVSLLFHEVDPGRDSTQRDIAGTVIRTARTGGLYPGGHDAGHPEIQQTPGLATAYRCIFAMGSRGPKRVTR